jgi:hypothetical protein
MQRTTATALQLVHDVLAERGPPANGGPFRMYAVDPADMPAHRRELVATYGHMVPEGITMDDAPRVAAAIVAAWTGNQ